MTFRRKKISTVASFEFLTTVKRKGYLITTFGMPVFVLLYGAFVSLLVAVTEGKESEVKVYGLVDDAGILALESDVEASPADVPPEVLRALEQAGSRNPAVGAAVTWLDNAVFRPFTELDGALAALRDGELKGVYLLPADYVDTGAVDIYELKDAGFSFSDAKGSLSRLIRRTIVSDQIAGPLAERIDRPLGETNRWSVAADGAIEPLVVSTRVMRILVPVAFIVLLFISLMMSAGYLLQGTAQEKENKVVEVLLSSANPDEVLTGKLFGLGAAGLLQVFVWFGMVIAASVFSAATLAAAGFELPWLALGTAIFFFIAAYLFLGSLMLGTGSLGSNVKEAQQYSLVWTLLSIVPMAVLQLLLQDPNGTLARVFTWIPFTAPVTVILRLSMEPSGVAWWEVVGSWLVVIACTWFSIRFGARLFRVGLLLTGSRPKLREILRQARLSA